MAGVPVVGPALAGFLELAVSWYSVASVEPDGSLNILMAPHFCGTKAGGVDLTAWPLPGIDPGAWGRVVTGLRRAGWMAEATDLFEGGVSAQAEGVARDDLEPPQFAAPDRSAQSESKALPWRLRLSLDMAGEPVRSDLPTLSTGEKS